MTLSQTFSASIVWAMRNSAHFLPIFIDLQPWETAKNSSYNSTMLEYMRPRFDPLEAD